jgi:bifunctional ADP-heptose synthase (sugar kinase/adenylyltransferase)
MVKRDILINGNEYKGNQIVGAKFMRQRRVKVITLSWMLGFSATAILSRRTAHA